MNENLNNDFIEEDNLLDKPIDSINNSIANAASAEEKSDSDFKWYCIRTYTGQEERIKQTIESEVKRLGLQSMIGEILVPLETTFHVRNGKRRTRVRNFLPGYIMVKALISEEKKTKNKVLDVIGGITGVVAFVGRKNDPAPLQESEIERIFGRVLERKGVETIENSFAIGDPIKIIDGPFSGFSGIVQEVSNENQKLKVEVVILGRKTPIELDFIQVEVEQPE
jgi:transcriptional antiterminator NusG